MLFESRSLFVHGQPGATDLGSRPSQRSPARATGGLGPWRMRLYRGSSKRGRGRTSSVPLLDQGGRLP